MASSFGNNIKITIFGGSHEPNVGLEIEGLPKGIKINKSFIDKELDKRKPHDELSTSRIEKDEPIFLSGLDNWTTTGDTIKFIIENSNIRNNDYVKGVIRPGHADYTNYIKYGDKYSFEGGGLSSGRSTAPLVVLGAICKQLLEEKGIIIGSHISEIHGIKDNSFTGNLIKEIHQLNESLFPVLDNEVSNKMKKEIIKAKDNKDSVGGSLETVIIGIEPGIGEPYFDSIESIISHLLFSIPGVKGVTFGDGVSFAQKYGSEANDEIRYIDGNIVFKSNHNGGINGGISNGMPICFKTYIKPTSSVAKKQESINIETKENIDLEINGRHDPCIVHRARAAVEAMIAYAILDLMMEK